METICDTETGQTHTSRYRAIDPRSASREGGGMMSRAPARFTKADVERAVKGVITTGVAVSRIEVGAGKIVFYVGDSVAQESPLEAWRRKNGKG